MTITLFGGPRDGETLAIADDVGVIRFIFDSAPLSVAGFLAAIHGSTATARHAAYRPAGRTSRDGLPVWEYDAGGVWTNLVDTRPGER